MLSFLNTAVLLGLLGVGLPVLIHLFAKKKLQRIEFSSTAFLKQIHIQRMRRMKLRQVLLLVLRCLVVFLLVTAFARPTLRTGGVSGSGRARSSIVLVVDRSLSVSRRGVFEKTRERAAGVVDLLEGEDEAALIWTVSSGKGRPTFTHDGTRLRQVLLKEGVSWERGVVNKSVEEAATLLSHSRNINREIYLVTDLQATGFSEPPDSDLAQRWGGRLFVLPVDGEGENVAVVGGGVENQILQPGAPLRIFAEVKNCGERKVEGLLVRVFIEGEATAQKVVSIEAGETQRVSLRIMPERSGWIWGSIRIDEDELSQDNEWFFTCRIPERIGVLLVGKAPDDVRSLRLALVPQTEEEKIFRVEKAFCGEDWVGKMDGADVVFFSNYPSFTYGEVERLKGFIEGGGGAFFLMGDDVDLRNFNEHFLFPVVGISLGNVFGSGEGGGSHLSFGSVDLDHPLFEGVFERGREKVRSPRFYRVVEVVGENFRKIVLLADGKPFLLEKAVGRGRVFLATSGLGENWSDLAIATVFAPLVTRSAAYLSSPFSGEKEGRKVGESVSLSTGVEDVNVQYRVEIPSGEEILVLPEVRGGRVTLTLQRVERAGIYRFYRKKTLLGMRAVNVDPRESDLRPLPEEELEKRFPKAQLTVIRDDERLESVVSEARWGRELWREILLLAVVVLVVEMFIAREGGKWSKRERGD